MGRAAEGEEVLAPKGMAGFEERTGGKASVNVLSLGFAATAILLSLFLLMALFERFLRPSSSPSPSAVRHATASAAAAAPAATFEKLHEPRLPACDPFAGVSVLMPGHSFPTFIANPLPLPLSQRVPALDGHAGIASPGSIFTHSHSPSFPKLDNLQQQGFHIPISDPH